jgi:hypothetical protein
MTCGDKQRGFFMKAVLCYPVKMFEISFNIISQMLPQNYLFVNFMEFVIARVPVYLRGNPVLQYIIHLRLVNYEKSISKNIICFGQYSNYVKRVGVLNCYTVHKCMYCNLEELFSWTNHRT